MKKLIRKIVPKQVSTFLINIITRLAIIYYSVVFKNLVIRKNSTDFLVFKTVFITNRLKLPKNIKPRLIIDAGAYTGLTSLFFSRKYPKARIIAVEPDEENFQILEKNTETVKKITPLQAGVWNKITKMRNKKRKTGEWGNTTTEAHIKKPNDIEALTINKILKIIDRHRIDILKIDIEGAEKQLFENNYKSWLSKVKVLVIELHDYIKKGCSKNFYEAVNNFDWTEHRNGEKVILVKK